MVTLVVKFWAEELHVSHILIAYLKFIVGSVHRQNSKTMLNNTMILTVYTGLWLLEKS